MGTVLTSGYNTEVIPEAGKYHVLELLRAKYTPEAVSIDTAEILDALLENDKYLHLAYWLDYNHEDWGGRV